MAAASGREEGSQFPLVIDNNRPDAAVPHLLIGPGKVADVNVMNRDNMGGFCAACQNTNSNIVQDVARPPDFGGCITVAAPNSENSKTGANTGTLYAYDAVTLAQLYTSDQAAEGREPAPCRQSL
jgi:hypothetical protein